MLYGSMEGDVAALAIAGFSDATVLDGAIGSGDDSNDDDDAALSEIVAFRPPLVPGADLKLARLQCEHELSMMELRHEKEVTALRQDLRRLQRQHRGELRRSDKVISALADERDGLTCKLEEANAAISQLSDRHAAVRRADARHREQLTLSRSQAAAEASTSEVTIASLRERLDEVMSRGALNERSLTELRRELEAANLSNQDLQRSVNEGREALQTAWRDASSATAAKDILAERVTMYEQQVERLKESKQLAEAAVQARTDELRDACAALAAAREQRNQAARDADQSRAMVEQARGNSHEAPSRKYEVRCRDVGVRAICEERRAVRDASLVGCHVTSLLHFASINIQSSLQACCVRAVLCSSPDVER